MKRQVFNNYVSRNDFKGLFVSEMGWNKVQGPVSFPDICINETSYKIVNIAQRSGFQVLVCETDCFPSLPDRKRIDSRLQKIANDYICIFYDEHSVHHQWIAPIRKLGKRTLVSIEYELLSQTDYLFSKIDGLYFELDEKSNIHDVKERVYNTFALNSEKITKDFYRGFRNVLTSFADHISGMEDGTPTKNNRWKQWYASIMLNRLIFCYFIQKKGFLDNNVNYLRDKLEWVRFEKGLNRFYDTFYKGFLISLFHEGLDSSVRNDAFYEKYGRIPYINGGIFASHMIESRYPQMDIDDYAFTELFDFFDTWQWHLDTRLTSSGKDINPDVLGYIFEQYINDKCDMGAFYTQEDITEFISKNCIIPALLETILKEDGAFHSENYATRLLRSNPEKYLYDSVKYGYSSDWQNCLPQSILTDTSKWNYSSYPSFGIPRETWRDTITRFKKCDKLLSSLSSNIINSVSDLITLNIDIRQFALDIIQTADAYLLKKIYNKLVKLRVLDPACGSGAFLFATMNVLEPLYEACFARMRALNNNDSHLFSDELSDVDKWSEGNEEFYTCLRIALDNIYGVDIMPEAIETAKLRLFLRIVSTLSVNPYADNLGLDPLPDIDFNLVSGNSLTGSSSANDIFSIKENLELLTKSVAEYKSAQFERSRREALSLEKKTFIKKYQDLDKVINTQLNSDSESYSWIDGNAPLNWPVRFYEVMNQGGFDSVIGNPPYVENSKVNYSVESFSTSSCGNLYTCMMERGFSLLKKDGYLGMIVQLPIVCTDRMVPAQNILLNRKTWLFNFDDRPGKLFENIQHIRATIVISKEGEGNVYCSRYNRWHTESRPYLFNSLEVVPYCNTIEYPSIPKIGDEISKSIIAKIAGRKKIEDMFERRTEFPMYYHNAPLYFTRGTNFLPYFKNEAGDSVSSSVKTFYFADAPTRDVCCCVLNSSLFYMWYVYFSDCRHLTKREIGSFPLGYDTMSNENINKLTSLCKELMVDLNTHKIRKVTNGSRNGFNEYDEFKPKASKPLMDKIDRVLADHFGFFNEETDFIINYDVKFRMGEDD